MRVAIVSGARSLPLMGLELAEMRLLDALRATSSDIRLDVRVVGGRSARRHARRLSGRWVPAKPATLPPWATSRCDLVHMIGLDLPPPRRTPYLAMVHDLSSLHFDDEGTLPSWVRQVAHDAALVLTPSKFTAGEVQRHLGVSEDRIRVIGGAPALEAADVAPLTPAELAEFGITTPFVLRYGGYTKRKGVPLLLEAWSRVELGTLVLVGPPQSARDAILAAAPSLERVVVLDYVPRSLLARLLRTATVLASTSSYEGYGLPLLEALAAGTPVVAVSEPFVHEVCDDATLLVERDANAMAAGLVRAVQDDALRHRLSREGRIQADRFSWSRVADNVMSGYQDVLSSSQ